MQYADGAGGERMHVTSVDREEISLEKFNLLAHFEPAVAVGCLGIGETETRSEQNRCPL